MPHPNQGQNSLVGFLLTALSWEELGLGSRCGVYPEVDVGSLKLVGFGFLICLLCSCLRHFGARPLVIR